MVAGLGRALVKVFEPSKIPHHPGGGSQSRSRGLDSNQGPSGYEPDELPLLHPALRPKFYHPIPLPSTHDLFPKGKMTAKISCIMSQNCYNEWDIKHTGLIIE